MNQTCKVCGEPAAGFHFGAFTCEGCKSFFGRSYNNLSSISECKNNGKCVIDKKNRTTCKACRLRKCYTVGMSKGGSRYGRRSNWFKIHCLLQEQQQQAVEAASKAAAASGNNTNPAAFGDMAAAMAAQQQFSQRSSHLAAATAPHLGYPAYLTPDMSAAPFMSAAALPFFSMMNSLPTMAAANSPPSAFQMPPHLLFPGYHPAAAAAAADAAYRSTELFKHRQSIDSASASGESQQHSPRFSPSNHSIHSLTHEDTHVQHRAQQQTQQNETLSARQSPILSVSVDDDEEDEQTPAHNSLHSQPTTISPASSQHHIHSPIAIRASPRDQLTTAPAAVEPSFAAKMQSLSPVSVCSITHETTPPTPHTLEEQQPMNQDCPMDLSMKTSRSSVQSDSDMLSETSEEERQQQNMRRKFFQLESSTENSENSSDDCEANKRQKLSENGYNTFGNTHHAQRGIVCV